MTAALTPREILRRRADALARPADPDFDGEVLNLLEFRLGPERYAVEVALVREVQPLRHLTPLPGLPPLFPGIVHVRGRIVPVVDLKRFLGIPEAGVADAHEIVLIEAEGTEVGLLADLAVGVGAVPSDSLLRPPAGPADSGGEYVRGLTEAHLIVLDARRILTDPRLVVRDNGNA